MKTKKLITCLTLLSVVFFGLSAQEKSSKTVQLKQDNNSCSVEVGEITKGENGYPTLTIYSTVISGNISMSASDMFPIIACAFLDNGEIVDPILVAGGVVGGSGYSMDSTKPLVKNTSNSSEGGTWKSEGGKGRKGYLTFYFETDQPIQKILIGDYANYAKSNYEAFVSAIQTYK